jgi:hypothetical protein
LLSSLFWPAIAAALPIASESEHLAGLRCFPDHEDPAIWWYLPDRLELVGKGDDVAFRFERYSYSGTSVTGDAGTVWWKGVLTLRLRFASSASAVGQARAMLSRRLGRPVSLQRLGVERVESVLLYASAGAAGPTGDLGSGDWGEAESRWEERSWILGLTPETTQMLWDEFHADGLAMSLGYSLSGTALSHRPAQDPFGGEAEVVEPEVVVLGGDALAIRVSPEECPACFASTELDAAISAEYPFLEARCYDFESGLAPSDLGLVIVEVRAKAVSGDELFEQARFAPGRATTLPIHFRFAVSLDDGYDHRVVKVFDDGHTEASEWVSRASWSGILDVTEYRQAAGGQLDARMLY